MILHFECYSGISGDMAVAAMLDLGADRDVLMGVLDSLPLDGYRVEITRKRKSALDVCDFDVILEHDNHDHDDVYLYGHDHHHEHHHGHHHDHHHDHHHGRGIDEIFGIIDAGVMTDGARDVAKRIFTILAEAEASVHGVPVEKVHFHEVGAIDSIVDIVALAVCIDNLGISDVSFSRMHEGTGTVRCQHGLMPVPVPAVAAIASSHGIALRTVDIQGELVTPTGIAFAAAVRTRDLPEEYGIVRMGMGGGKRETGASGILRAMILSPCGGSDMVCLLECNIDDCSGEVLGYTMDRLFEEGARDVFYTPVFMKKNRPAYMLSVVCSESDADRMEDLMFSETTTIGIRRMNVDRTVMGREVRTVDTPLGPVDVKFCTRGGISKAYPEYESLIRICRERGIGYREAYDTVLGLVR